MRETGHAGQCITTAEQAKRRRMTAALYAQLDDVCFSRIARAIDQSVGASGVHMLSLSSFMGGDLAGVGDWHLVWSTDFQELDEHLGYRSVSALPSRTEAVFYRPDSSAYPKIWGNTSDIASIVKKVRTAEKQLVSAINKQQYAVTYNAQNRKG